jgi:hypothetical protein
MAAVPAASNFEPKLSEQILAKPEHHFGVTRMRAIEGIGRRIESLVKLSDPVIHLNLLTDGGYLGAQIRSALADTAFWRW